MVEQQATFLELLDETLSEGEVVSLRRKENSTRWQRSRSSEIQSGSLAMRRWEYGCAVRLRLHLGSLAQAPSLREAGADGGPIASH